MASPPLPHLHDTGQGPALLFLHAFPLDASQWDAQVAGLSGAWRCLRPDFWGCGNSPPPPAEATLRGYAGAVMEQLQHLGIEHFGVIALSMGGYVAFELCRLAGERLTTLVLADTRAQADTQEAKQQREEIAQKVLHEGVETIVEANVQRLLGAEARQHAHITDPLRGRIRRYSAAAIAAAQMAMAQRADASAILKEIKVPTLVICGENDEVTPLGDAQFIAATIPDARLEIIPRTGHLTNLEAPHQFTALIAGFLDANVTSVGTPAGA